MIDVYNKRCPNCVDWPDSQLANRKYRNYCARCFQRLFPKDPLSSTIRCKTKELIVRDFLNENYPDFIHDRAITTPDCSCLRRIDHRALIEDTLLCIETDENQHKGYNREDEEKRYHDVHITWGVGKVIWIRFNPDAYIVNSKKKNPHISTRLRELAKQIDHHTSRIKNNDNTDLVEIHFIYFDESN
jgi:ribosomal protein S27AE